MTVTREYEMDERRVLREPDFEPPARNASQREKRAWLRESFYELCGFDRIQDHLDGKFVWRTIEEVDADFYWPDALGGGIS